MTGEIPYYIYMKGNFPIEKFGNIETPFYYYDADVLQQSLDAICDEMAKHRIKN